MNRKENEPLIDKFDEKLIKLGLLRVLINEFNTNPNQIERQNTGEANTQLT
ncbi:MAG: hypothetical protein AAF372_05535 [Pseudomonadota bacterium]